MMITTKKYEIGVKPNSFSSYKYLKVKLRVLLTSHTLTKVTRHAKIMIITCLGTYIILFRYKKPLFKFRLQHGVQGQVNQPKCEAPNTS